MSSDGKRTEFNAIQYQTLLLVLDGEEFAGLGRPFFEFKLSSYAPSTREYSIWPGTLRVPSGRELIGPAQFGRSA